MPLLGFGYILLILLSAWGNPVEVSISTVTIQDSVSPLSELNIYSTAPPEKSVSTPDAGLIDALSSIMLISGTNALRSVPLGIVTVIVLASRSITLLTCSGIS